MFGRISESLPKYQIRDFAGGPLPHTMLSHMEHHLIGMLSPKTQATLASLGRNTRHAVKRHVTNLGKNHCYGQEHSRLGEKGFRGPSNLKFVEEN